MGRWRETKERSDKKGWTGKRQVKMLEGDRNGVSE